MNQSITPQQMAAIKEYVDTHRDEIIAVYLYGSEAEGVANALSDVDLAVLLREPTKRSPMEIRIELTVTLGHLVDREVDVQVLTMETSLPFLEEVFKQKKLVAVNDEAYMIDYQRKMMLKIIDFQPALERLHAAMMRRIAHGTYGTYGS